ncbi:hypothetical protein [Streptomyces sp. NPDC001139]
MKLISGAKYAALQTLQLRTARDLEASEKLAAERLATITRLRAELEQAQTARTGSPAPQPRPATTNPELARQLRLANRALAEMQERLDSLQTSHVADTRELHDLRQEVTS